MAFLAESTWRLGHRRRFDGTANLDAFTDTRWVTMRGEIAPYPF